MTQFLEELKKRVKGDVMNDEATLSAASTDASIFKIKPTAVIFPKDKDDVTTAVRMIAERKKAGENVSITGRSAGTDMSGGPLTESFVLSFTKYMNHVRELTHDRAVVEPGVYYRDLEPGMDRLGVMLPSYPASKGLCAMGGIVSNNSGGEKTLAYGKTERYVEKLKVVFSDGYEYEVQALTREELNRKMEHPGFEGDLYRNLFKLIEDHYDEIQAARPQVSKNSAGYYLWNVWDREKQVFDLTKLITGSQGTLGMLTEITLRLVPKKKHSRMAVIFLKDLSHLGEISNEVLKFKPESFESYDDKTLGLALKFFFDILKILVRKGENIFWLGWQFIPEFFMVLRGGLPKLVLIAEVTGDDEKEIVKQLKGIRQALQPFKDAQVRLTKSEAEGEKYWTIRRESFNLLRNKVHNRKTAPFIDDIVVRPDQLQEFLPKLNAILDPYGKTLMYTIAGHVGNGNFHVIPLVRVNDPEVPKVLREVSDKVYDLVHEFHGSITGEHNDGLIRTPYLNKMYSENILAMFKEVKHIFDPQSIFNPKKKVGGDLDYAFRHLR